MNFYWHRKTNGKTSMYVCRHGLSYRSMGFRDKEQTHWATLRPTLCIEMCGIVRIRARRMPINMRSATKLFLSVFLVHFRIKIRIFALFFFVALLLPADKVICSLSYELFFRQFSSILFNWWRCFVGQPERVRMRRNYDTETKKDGKKEKRK